MDNPDPNGSPSDKQFPYGFFQFTIEDLPIGAATTVKVYLLSSKNVNTYYKYGATPADPVSHWYKFMYDGETGAEITADVVTLNFVDGLRGDDDLTANGRISDVGGPASTVSTGGGGGGGGGGCFISTLNF
jgi:hypothetical protein